MPKSEKMPSINVAAGVLQDKHGQVLISQRLPGTHQEGAWEFPGGKIDVGETPLAALLIQISVARRLLDSERRVGFEPRRLS